jgi:VanZ family protein
MTFLKFIFHLSILLLIIISFYPGSLIGYLLYGDFGQQPELVDNRFGTSINHFFYYLYVSILGFLLYLKKKNFKLVFYSLLFLSIVLELVHFIIPNRSFQFTDLIGNILGVIVAYCILSIYLLFNKK